MCTGVYDIQNYESLECLADSYWGSWPWCSLITAWQLLFRKVSSSLSECATIYLLNPLFGLRSRQDAASCVCCLTSFFWSRKRTHTQWSRIWKHGAFVLRIRMLWFIYLPLRGSSKIEYQ